MTRHFTLDDELSAVVATIERRTGLDEAAVVRSALQEKLERIDRERLTANRLKELKLVLERLTPPLGKGTYMTHAEGDAWLYDERGLPH